MIFRVFVFPSCNEVGLEIIQALSKSNKIQLFGGSSYDVTHDPSRLLLKNHALCPGHEDPDFDARFRDILDQHAIDVLFPAWDPLVARFAAWELKHPRCIAPCAATAQLLLSKAATYAALREVVPSPEVYPGAPPRYPAFAKPDRGSGSKNIMLLENEADFQSAVARGLLIMEYLPGIEYTADCLSGLDGRLMVCNPRRRGLIGRGIALGTEGVSHPEIEAYCAAISSKLNLAGPWLAQFKMDSGGRAKLLEVNARVAGSMGLTRHSGVNIPLMSVFMFMGEPVLAPRLHGGVIVNRHLNFQVEAPPFQWAIWDLDDTLLRKDGKPDPDAVASLYDCFNRGIRQILLSKKPGIAEKMRGACLPETLFAGIHWADDKLAGLDQVFHQHGFAPEDAIMINDSYAETFAVQAKYPGLRTLTPDALAVLGREPIE